MIPPLIGKCCNGHQNNHIAFFWYGFLAKDMTYKVAVLTGTHCTWDQDKEYVNAPITEKLGSQLHLEYAFCYKL